MSDYEPPAEMVEAEAERLEFCFRRGDSAESMARFVLRRQHERERRLLAGIVRAQEWLSVGSMDTAQHELSETRVWYNKLDAPKVPEAPTLLDLVNAFDFAYGGVSGSAKLEAWQAIRDYAKAAVEREEKRKKR